MARKVRDAVLDSKAARSKLKPRGKPYYRPIDPGWHLGYRKPKTGPGSWSVRVDRGADRDDGDRYRVERIATADDFSDANGADVLTFWQAVEAVRKRRVDNAAQKSDKDKPLTVADAMAAYLAGLAPRAAADARYRSDAFILPALGEREVASLTVDDIRSWHRGIAANGGRLRSAKGAAVRHREAPATDDEHRRRQATANRVLTVLKAALNLAWRDGKVSSDNAWRQAKPFKDVERARDRYLTVAEAQRLMNAAEPDFRRMVQAALMTGARYGELARLTMADFNADTGSLAIRRSKSGKARHVELTEEGVTFFAQQTLGRPGDALIFCKSDGSPWGASHQRRRMGEACKRASISPPIGFHGLRHTWASLAIMAGMPLLVAAQNLGHADGRMVERTYGHLSRDYLRDAVRASAPTFGAVEPSNARAMSRAAS